MKWLWLSIQVFLLILLAATGFIYLANRQAQLLAHGKIKDSMTEVRVEEPPRVGIVFGAGVQPNGEPSLALHDRIVTAVELYRAKRVRKLLMSGDNRFENYNEPNAMKEIAIKLGVRESGVVQDFAGRRTYDTCFRAREIFGVRRAILVTQEFHLPRAIFLCESIGIDSYGIIADRRQYEDAARLWWSWRESVAVAAAWLDVNVLHPTPILGKHELIEP